MKTYAQGLWVTGGDPASATQIVDPQTFSALFAPAFSPDGKRLVFGAVGEPTSGVSYRTPSGGVLDSLTGLLDIRAAVAEAHGAPWDLWSVNVDGSGLRRLTSIAEDAPVAVWSPDGSQIAFSGERAIYLLDPEGKTLLRVADEYGSAGMAWLR
jgi:Tol biopolymer transport system component